MAATATTPTPNANVEAIIADYKSKLPKAKLNKLVGGAAASIFGADLAKLSTIVPNLIGSFLDKLFSMPSPWSRLSETDKTNLIDSLAQQSIWTNNVIDLEVAKFFVLAQLVTNNIIDTDQKNTFYAKNGWAINHIQSQLSQYAASLKMANDIADTAKNLIVNYDNSKMSLKALTAIYNFKKGIQPSADENAAIKSFLQLQNAVAVSKSLRKG